MFHQNEPGNFRAKSTRDFRACSRRPSGLCLSPPHTLSSPSTMREVISVHVGQAGVQIGNACCKFDFLRGVLEASQIYVCPAPTRRLRV